jgi:shikimate kinase
MLRSKKVFLIGFMGAGKTSVGRVLAQRMNWKFYDLDELIEHRRQRSIAAIFAAEGEQEFRRAESTVLSELLKDGLDPSGSIIALGGGCFVQPENRRALEQANAITVLLKAPLEELQHRCQDAGGIRPLAGDKAKFEQLFASRQPAYALARFHVETAGKAIEEVAQEIEQIVRKEA